MYSHFECLAIATVFVFTLGIFPFNKTKSTSIGLQTSKIWLLKKFPIYFVWSIIFVLTNYLQLLLYISYEQSDLYMLVTTKSYL